MKGIVSFKTREMDSLLYPNEFGYYIARKSLIFSDAAIKKIVNIHHECDEDSFIYKVESKNSTLTPIL